LTIHDGAGTSFWLSAVHREAGDPAKKAAAKMDWSFMVWQADAWQQQQQNEYVVRMLQRHGAHAGGDSPPTEISVYTGGSIHWSEVAVPDGIDIDDRRMATHGFSPVDGNVLEGK